MERLLRYILLMFALLTLGRISAHTLRYISNADGLSNSSVISLMQDSRGFIWIGTCDGLNLFDGNVVMRYNKRFFGHDIDGSIISGILESTDGNMWVQSNYGLHRCSLFNDEYDFHEGFPEYKGRSEHSQIYSDNGRLYLVAPDGRIYYNESGSDKIMRLDCIDDFTFAGIKNIVWINEDIVEIFTGDGIATYHLKKNDEGAYSLNGPGNYIHVDMSDSFKDGTDIWIVTKNGLLQRYSRNIGTLSTVADLSDEISARNVVTSVCTDKRGNVYVGFKSDGLMKIMPDGTREDVGIRSGVFSMIADRNQDIVWVGTDGLGVVQCINSANSFSTYMYTDLLNILHTPARAVFKDGNTMYVGTKGDGILRIDDFEVGQPVKSGQLYLVNTRNSALLDNSVYAIERGRRPIMWIGTELGINCYDMRSHTLKMVANHPAELKYIHAIVEENDSVLWMASVGKGIFRVTVGSDINNPSFKSVENFTIADGNSSSNYFFALIKTRDGAIYAGNRGNGVFTVENGKLVKLNIGSNVVAGKRINDVFSIASDDNGTLWVGTSNGLLRHDKDGSERLYNESFGFPNGYIHSIHHTGKDIWLGTNAGLIRFIPETEAYQVYNHHSGVDMLEYSDGAIFNRGGELIFGGTNGFVITTSNFVDESRMQEYHPAVLFTRLYINGEFVVFNSRIDNSDGDVAKLRLNYNENNFALGISTPDYINTANLAFYYKLQKDDEWMATDGNNNATFTSLPPGKYVVQTKYRDLVTGRESEISSLAVTITPPWYLSAIAKCVYVMIGLGILYLLYRRLRQLNHNKQRQQLEKIEQAHNAEMYEQKLRFFTNITHEFCTPLTLIYGPCERLLSYKRSDAYITRYVNLIKSNAERLNGLIQELIDFRRLETGNRERNVDTVDVSALAEEIVASFEALAEQNGVRLERKIQPLILFDTDKSSLNTIFYNLISNAFKYTPSQGVIRVSVGMEDEKLRVAIYNTGKGITERDRARIFNRYVVLDNLESNATKGLSARNGLGLAICHSMVEFLEGTIDIESTPGEYAEFIVTLPQLPITAYNPASPDVIKNEIKPNIESEPKFNAESEYDDSKDIVENVVGSKGRILVVDDDKEILVLLREGLDEYTVVTATSVQEALSKIRDSVPDIVITDVMMPVRDGISLVKELKSNQFTLHVPVIVLSAKHSNDDKINGLRAGADAYVPKPFTFTYLHAVIDRLLKRREQMVGYYSSSAVAYQYSGGKLQKSEDKVLIDKVAKFIDENIDNEMLNSEMIAEHVALSLRSLYRRFKEMEHIPPNEFIKERRLAHAAHLLVTTTLTVKVVAAQSGFNNRSHFYREFSKRYGVLPIEYRKSKQVLDQTEPEGDASDE